MDPLVSAPNVTVTLDLRNTLDPDPSKNYVGLPSPIPLRTFSISTTDYALQLYFPSDKLLSGGKGNTNIINLNGTLTATSPIPEPASLLLLGTGLARWRRRRR